MIQFVQNVLVFNKECIASLGVTVPKKSAAEACRTGLFARKAARDTVVCYEHETRLTKRYIRLYI